jgi:hypothetical protein
MVVPIHGQRIKPVYVRQVIEKLDEIFPAGEGEDFTEDVGDE